MRRPRAIDTARAPKWAPNYCLLIPLLPISPPAMNRDRAQFLSFPGSPRTGIVRVTLRLLSSTEIHLLRL
jgi:hypothetical protein